MISQINFQSSPAQSHYIVKQSKHKYDTEVGYSMYKKVGNKTKIRYKANEMEGWDNDHHDTDRYRRSMMIWKIILFFACLLTILIAQAAQILSVYSILRSMIAHWDIIPISANIPGS